VHLGRQKNLRGLLAVFVLMGSLLLLQVSDISAEDKPKGPDREPSSYLRGAIGYEQIYSGTEFGIEFGRLYPAGAKSSVGWSGGLAYGSCRRDFGDASFAKIEDINYGVLEAQFQYHTRPVFFGIGPFASLIDWSQATGERGGPREGSKELQGFAWGGSLSLGITIGLSKRVRMDLGYVLRVFARSTGDAPGGLAPVYLGVRYRI
jgi:hypothetical protein